MGDPKGPLTGCRVLEMGSTVAGPFCGRLLADFGAEVIKIEPVGGDPIRSMGKRYQGVPLYSTSIFRGKSLISIDLRKEEGQAIARRLAARCAILVENFRPGVLEKWGLGWEELSAVNPGLIMVRISGYGQTGPYRRRAGYGIISEAMSGLRYVTGEPDRLPSRAAVSLTDCLSGLYAAFGAMLALVARNRTGLGQVVDAALYECAFTFMETHVAAYEKLGFIATRAGSRLPDSCPNNLYPAADGGSIHITALSDSAFGRLAVVMGREDLMDHDHFRTAVGRSEHEDEVDQAIMQWTMRHPTNELEEKLVAAGVPASRIYTMADIFQDPHYGAREMIARVPHEDLGMVAMPAVVPKLSLTPGSITHAGGRVGRDTRAVLAGLGGFSNEEIDALATGGVIYCSDTASERNRTT